MKKSEVIRETKTVLFEDGWHKGHFHNGPYAEEMTKTSDGEMVLRRLVPPREVEHCTLGAVEVAVRESFGLVYHGQMVDWLQESIRDYTQHKFMFIADWNDHDKTTFNDVIDFLDYAEKQALIEEEQA